MKKKSPQKIRREQHEAEFHKLVYYLLKNRALGNCEIRAKGCVNCCFFGHHIKRQGRVNLPSNILIACLNCHNHAKYASGTPLSTEGQLLLAKKLNAEHSIPDGYMV